MEARLVASARIAIAVGWDGDEDGDVVGGGTCGWLRDCEASEAAE